MIPVIRPASGIVKTGRMPSPSGSQSGGVEQQPSSPGRPSVSIAPTYAPIPMNAPWPSEICPL